LSPNVAWSSSLKSYHPYLHPEKVLKIPEKICIHSTVPKIAKSRFGRLGTLQIKFIIILNACISIREVMICSMFISEVSEMRTSIVWAVLTFLGDDTQ